MKRFMIYFFGTDYERVKIGHCYSNLYRRQCDIRNGCPDPLKLLGIIVCRDKAEMLRREREIHRQFKKFRTVGEWFRLVTEISEYIEEFTECGEDILDECREGYNNKQNQWQQATPERRAKNREYNKCPENRKHRNRNLREKYSNDPDYRERRVHETREYSRKKRVVSEHTLTLPGLE